MSRASDKERGTASLEAVLSLPILLVIFMLVDHSARSMMLKLDVTVQARTKAWNEAFHGVCTGYRNTKIGSGSRNPVSLGIGSAAGVRCSTDKEEGPGGRENFGETVMRQMQKEGEQGDDPRLPSLDLPRLPRLLGRGAGSESRGDPEITRDVRKSLKPLTVESYQTWHYPRWWRIPVTARAAHAVSPVAPPDFHWNIRSEDPEDEVLQLSYDKVLSEKLQGGMSGPTFGRSFLRRTDYLFKELFPEVPPGS